MSNQIKSPIKYWRIENAEVIQSLLKPVENFAASFGLQPFRIVVTKNNIDIDVAANKKEKLPAESWQLVFAAKKEITKSDIDNFIEGIRGAKKYSTSSLNSYRKIFEDSVNSKNESGITWSEKQARSGLDILLASARQINSEVSIDYNIDANLFDTILNLDKEGYNSLFSASVKIVNKNKFTKTNQQSSIKSFHLENAYQQSNFIKYQGA